jgi:hypothetical protein
MRGHVHDGSDHANLIARERALIQQINRFDWNSELTDTMQWLAIGEPIVLLLDFL